VDLRRQTSGGLAPAVSSRDERLDPFTLPVHFTVNDKAADERVRFVELSRERVTVRRAVRGIKMAVNVPVAAYLGVAIRMEPPAGEDDGAVLIVLEHRDPGLSLPLYRADDAADIVAEWQSWARVLNLPPLVVDTDGRLREPFARIGLLRISPPTWRRRRRSTLRLRRPTFPLRRKVGRPIRQTVVHRGEREIIARH
jgi:Family of unknown function (DUF6101)